MKFDLKVALCTGYMISTLMPVASNFLPLIFGK